MEDIKRDDIPGNEEVEVVETAATVGEEVAVEKEPAEQKTKQQLLQVMADFENYKRRTAKDRAFWSVITEAKVLKAFLPLVDDIGLALDVANASQLADADREWLAGFTIVQNKFNDIFKAQDVEEIDCTSGFDPNFHEALMSVESDTVESGQIVEVFRKGYKLKDTVLRHAQVSVAK